MLTYVEDFRRVITKHAFDAPGGKFLSAVKSAPDTRPWFDRLTIPSFVEGD